MNPKSLQILCICVLFWQADVLAQCANSSNIYSFTYAGKTYEVVKELKSWNNAAACAVERGGYLAEINDVNEQTAIYNAIVAAGISAAYVSVPDGGGTAYVWMGATDKLTEGTWIWDGNNDSTGTPFWSGQGQAGAGGGAAVDANYNNWGKENGTGATMEPDDFDTGQDAGAIALAGWPSPFNFLGIAGQWNDIDINNALYFVIETDITVGITESNNEYTTFVYPNPCKDQLQVKAKQALQGMAYQVYDLTGKLILTDVFENNNTINTHPLQAGMYCLHFTDGISPAVVRFIKQ